MGTGALGVARYVLPQLLAQLARAVDSQGADSLARTIMQHVSAQLSQQDLAALAQVLPALGHECRNQLAVRGGIA